jgi:uncharacterized protein (DUF58 family)
MSGSGGSGGGGGGGFSGGDDVDCRQLVINTQLSSPKADVVGVLAEGTELQIEIDLVNGTSVVVAKFDNRVAGGLAAPETARLRQCLEQGHRFGATVVQVTGGQVRVRVHPV